MHVIHALAPNYTQIIACHIGTTTKYFISFIVFDKLLLKFNVFGVYLLM